MHAKIALLLAIAIAGSSSQVSAQTREHSAAEPTNANKETDTPFGIDFLKLPTGGKHARFHRELQSTGHEWDELREAAAGLAAAAQLDPKDPHYLKIAIGNGSPAAPNGFCSSAVDLYFLASIEELQKRKDSAYAVLRDAELNRDLVDIGSPDSVVKGKLDGDGIFGHLNANGPGPAVLFHKLGLGPNFLYGTAPVKKGDLLKIFWKYEIGKNESGHLVVVDHSGVNEEGKPGVFIWSNNSQGYGLKFVPDDSIKLGVVSRMKYPERLARWKALPEQGVEATATSPAIAGKNDPYLARMNNEVGTLEELAANTGIEIPESFRKTYYANKSIK